MNEDISKIIDKLYLNDAVSESRLFDIQRKFGIRFPADYVDFLKTSNGAEGNIGQSYIMLWSLEDIVTLNEAYAVNEFAPGLLIIGSDGGGTAYAFDLRTEQMQLVEVPFIGMSLDEIRVLSNTFDGFINYLDKN
jgi:hypothetical protein